MDLSTTYMGLELSGPLVPSASPLSRDIDVVRRMEDAGASAVVLWSLFEEQIEHEARELEFYLQYGADRFAESLTYFPRAEEYHLGPDQYLDHIRLVKGAVEIPVIASLNGISSAGWTSYARKIAQAGADAVELNVYYVPTDTALTADRVERVYLDVLEAVKAEVAIPVAMKLSPYFSSPAHMMHELDLAGADALVLFNRFYQPDIDVHKLQVRPRLTLSRSCDNGLAQRWVAILFGKVRASLAATGGIHTGEDVAKLIMAGADVAMLCSALLENGPGHLVKVREELVKIMRCAGYESLSTMKGVLSRKSCGEPAAFERANYMKALQGFGGTATLE